MSQRKEKRESQISKIIYEMMSNMICQFGKEHIHLKKQLYILSSLTLLFMLCNNLIWFLPHDISDDISQDISCDISCGIAYDISDDISYDISWDKNIKAYI